MLLRLLMTIVWVLSACTSWLRGPILNEHEP